ncbi:MAG: ATP-dependent DNA helicase RecG [Tissierellia bacterium]|nr:ATP-dependent DNA helicase RecG [Tissierellia bacterium]
MKLQDIRGLGKRKEEILSTMGINSIEDLVYYFPTKFEDRRKALEPSHGSQGSFCGRLISKEHWRSKKGTQSLRLHIAWQGYVIEVLFFNALYLDKQFVLDRDYCFYGQLIRKGIYFSMVHPVFAPAEDRDFFKLTPIYPYKKGLGQKDLGNFIAQALEGEVIKDYLFEEDRLKWKLMDLGSALYQMHFPSSRQDYGQAKYRLIFDDFFKFFLENVPEKRPATKRIERGDKNAFLNLLDFKMTEDQLRALDDIEGDLSSGRQMQRLVQGDVGSGKSAVAYYGLWKLLDSGLQSAYLAPTELLARQQFEKINLIFPGRALFLVGSSRNKKEIYETISSGSVDIVVGTHALFEDQVNFKNLGLVIADEQQRFGVAQRRALYDKGQTPHILMLSATPIPRTLSMILHRNLDISYIRHKPPGRKAIETKIVRPEGLKQVYEHIKEEIAKDRRAFIVFPLIEESEKLDIISLEEGIEELVQVFKGDLGYVHGRMDSQAKEQVLEAFKRGDIKVLASTTVIEVGIDIKDASILLLRGAERFGLSQIHQIRGRIGRNDFPSYCYLCAEKNLPERLEVLVEYDDGFSIAEEDLRLRGPGELRGIRQSGDLNFRFADLIRHKKILEEVASIVDDELINKYSSRREALDI